MRRAAGPLVLGAFGVMAVVGAALLVEMGATEALKLALYAGGGAVATGVVGAAVLSLCRRCSIGVQAGVVAATSVLAVAAGATAAANAMFLAPPEDLTALTVVLVSAGTIGTLIALVLGRRVASASRSVTATARRIGEGDFSPAPERPATEEFESLARELQKMSLRLEEARAKELALESSRRELIAWVSHDLRTPLAGIRAMAEALEDGIVEDPSVVTRYYKTMRLEIDRLAMLVDDLFELSRINAGALRLEMENVSLGDLVSDALAAASGVADAKGVRLEGRLHGDAPQLAVSAPEVTRVLRNLLENAIRHTPSDGTVSVVTGVEREHAYVEVADSCGGIPQTDIDRVFDTAFRGEAARTPGLNGGTGLGLAIARGIVEAHAGEISVHNEGAGCHFTIRLPISDPAEPTA